jgi:ribosomal protein S13
LEGDLKQEKEQNIEKLKAIRCRKGKLHDKNKKVRGQRTHSNNRTRPKGIESTTVRAVAIAGKKAPKQQG